MIISRATSRAVQYFRAAVESSVQCAAAAAAAAAVAAASRSSHQSCRLVSIVQPSAAEAVFCSLGSTDKYCARYVWPKNLSIIAGYIFCGG